MKIQDLEVGKSYKFRYCGGYRYTTIYTITKISAYGAHFVADNGSTGILKERDIKELEEVRND